MDRVEMVEKLKEKADVSYEEAKAALENTDWDMLDAMISLEKEGKVRRETGSYSTKSKGAKNRNYYDMPHETTGVGDVFRKLFKWLGKLIKRGNRNTINADRYGERIISVPVTAFVLALLLGFWAIIPIMIVGLFFGFAYSFSGPDLGRDDFNEVIGKATKVAENIKDEFKDQRESRATESPVENSAGENAGGENSGGDNSNAEPEAETKTDK